MERVRPRPGADGGEERTLTDLSHDDVKKILEIIDGAAHLDEIEVVFGGFHLRVQRGGGVQSSAPTKPFAPKAPQAASPSGPGPGSDDRAEPVLGEGEVAVRAPMLGTFYRAPSPGAPPFVEVGQRVRSDDTVCIIEVMKLFNSIKAGVDGVVTRILVENAKLVEYNQALIVVSTIA
jgi:acetyl-CoA carboxylase biotin carboxyl carrier protein